MFIYTLENIITGAWKTVTDEDIATHETICRNAGLDPSEWKIWDTIDPEREQELARYW